MKKAMFFGVIEHDGTTARLVIPDKEQVAQVAWEKLEGRLKEVKPGKFSGSVMVKITIVEDDKGKDLGLQRYYWSILLDDIAAAFRDLGNDDFDKDRAHDEMKKMFAPIHDGRHTTQRMGRREFMEYIARVERFAVQFLAIKLREKVRPGSMPTEPPPG